MEKVGARFRHAEKFRHALGCGATADALALSFEYQPLISKVWESIRHSQYEPLHLEARITFPLEALAS